MILCTFLILILDYYFFNAWFKFLMYITYFHFSLNLLQVFQHFQFLLFQEKTVNIVIFRKSNINFKKIPFITFICIAFYETLIKFRNILNHLKSFTGNSCDNSHPYKLVISKCLRYDDFFYHNFLCICYYLFLINE